MEANGKQVNNNYNTVRCTRFQAICKQYGTEAWEQFTFTFKLGYIEVNAYYNFTLIYLQSTFPFFLKRSRDRHTMQEHISPRTPYADLAYSRC